MDTNSEYLITEEPSKALLKFWLPMLVGNLIQQLYGIVDTIVSGRFINANALAAVGTGSIVLNVITGIGTGLATGCCVVIAQMYGAKRNKDVKTGFNTSIRLFLVLGVIATILGVVLTNPLLNLLGTPDDYYAYAHDYLQTIFLGVTFVLLYNGFNQISNALGDSTTPMLALIISSVLNVALDLLFVVVFDWGTRGIAVATFIAQGVAAIACYFIIKNKINKLEVVGDKKFDKNILKQICSIGLPSALQNVVSSSGSLAMQRLYNSFGTMTVSAFTAANKVDGFGMAPLVAVGTAVSTYTAQNLGANKKERVKEGLKASFKITIVVWVITAVIIYFNAESLLGLFVDASTTSEEFFEIGVEYLHISVFSYAIMAAMFIFTGLLRGAGDTKTVFWCSIADLLGRAAFAYALSGVIGRHALWFSYSFGWFCSLAISVPVYLKGKWKDIKLVDKELSND